MKTRSSLLRTLARIALPSLASLGGLILCGCLGSDKSQIVPPVVNTPHKVTVLGWHDYMDPEALGMFTKATGVEVEYLHYDSSEALRGMLESEPGRYDVVIADEASVAE